MEINQTFSTKRKVIKVKPVKNKHGNYVCGSCGALLLYHVANYCHHCGAVAEWEKVGDKDAKSVNQKARLHGNRFK